MTPTRRTLSAVLIVMTGASVVLAGCTASTTIHTNKQFLVLVQHTVMLTIAPGQTAQGTASCALGETLVSGGYFTSDALPIEQVAIVGDYPSDAAGTAPSSQGQSEDSWSLIAINPATQAVHFMVSADCLKGIPLSSGIWYQPTGVLQGVGIYGVIHCPGAPKSVLTGGGEQLDADQLQAPMYSAGPIEYDGVANQGWSSFPGSPGTLFAVCTTGVIADPMVTTSAGTISQDTPGNYFMNEGVACPNNEVAVGGGFFNFALPDLGIPMNTDDLAVGDPTQWVVGYNNSGANQGEPPDQIMQYVDGLGICVEAQWNSKVPITFSNYHWLLRIPADDVSVATDGSGEVNASQVTERVNQAVSAPLDAVITKNPFTGGISYAVPAGCGNPAPADDAATAALKRALAGKVPAGQVVFGSPQVTLDQSTLTCSPGAGTNRTTPFTYTQAIDGSITQASYNPLEVSGYQRMQLQQAAKARGGAYILRDTLICPQGPKLVSATSTRAEVQCEAYGVAEWQWTADALQSLAQALAGKSKTAAQQLLDGTPGIVAGSAVIDVVQGTTLPSNPKDITLIVVRPQDTAPVVRAP